jgi:GH35 family endo-1,4-beta-xylanase
MSQTGLLVHISELDINLSNGTTGDQDYRWYHIPKIYRQLVPSARRWGITLWNIGDSDNWQGTSAAATLYAPITYAKKNAYVNFYRGLNE